MSEIETRVHQATAEQAAALVPLYDWLFAEPGSAPPQWEPAQAAQRLAAAAESGQSAVLTANAGTAVVGFCTVYLDILSVRYGRRAWVEDLAVSPDDRSRGTGGALLDAAFSWAQGRGASHLELDSGLARVDAHRFYERRSPTWRSLCFGWQLAGAGAGET